MHYFKRNLFYFVIYIKFVCSPSFTPIHISKYRRPEKAGWRINNVITYIPYLVIWESILYNMCITNQYFTLDLLKIHIFLLLCTFWGIASITTANSLGLTGDLHLYKKNPY